MSAVQGSPGFYDVKNVDCSLGAGRPWWGAFLPRSFCGLPGYYAAPEQSRGYWSEEETAQVLTPLFQALTPNKYLEDRISGAILSEEEIADAASPALTDIRRHMRQQSAKIRETLQKVVSSPAYSKYLREPIVTIRQGPVCGTGEKRVQK